MQFAAEMNRLEQMLSYVRTEARNAGFDGEEVKKIEIAAEEALVNVIQHAYRGHSLGEIEIACHSPGRHILEIALTDYGPPFNPLEGGEVEHGAPLEQRQIGGLGLYFMRSLMDSVGYQRQGNRNVLTMMKKS